MVTFKNNAECHWQCQGITIHWLCERYPIFSGDNELTLEIEISGDSPLPMNLRNGGVMFTVSCQLSVLRPSIEDGFISLTFPRDQRIHQW